MYIGLWKDTKVVVKIINVPSKSEWENEEKAIDLCLRGHENVFRLIHAAVDTHAPLTCYWLITEYHPLDSLYDFLKSNILTPVQMKKMGKSIACGLNFLHREVKSASRCKPALAQVVFL